MVNTSLCHSGTLRHHPIVTTILLPNHLQNPLLQRRSQHEKMVKQMPLQWEARHRSEAPDPLYVTASPPEVIHKSRADQVLDDAHQRAFKRAVTNILSTPIAEETFAQIADGLPLRSVAIGTQNHRVLRGDPIEKHVEMCPGAIEKAREFRKGSDPMRLEIASAVSDRIPTRLQTQSAVTE